jgi:hypothetical protein
MKYFSDYQSLKEYISAICSETHVSPTHVEVVTQQLIEQLGFTKDIASAFAKAVLVYHNANSADCVASNALKLSGHWLAGPEERDAQKLSDKRPHLRTTIGPPVRGLSTLRALWWK